MKLRDYLSQTTIILDKNCNLRCGGCPLWTIEKWADSSRRTTDTSVMKKNPDAALEFMKKTITKGLFFEQFPDVKTYTIVGGDPFQFQGLPMVLKYLKKHRKKVRLWTNGLVPFENWESIAPLCDQVLLYIASSERELYRDITGYDGIPRLRDLIPHLRQQTELVLNMPITAQNVPFLPEFYDLAYEFQLPFILHYNPKAGFENDSIHFIKRYRYNARCTVFKAQYAPTKLCATVPKRPQLSRAGQAIENITEWWSHARNVFSLYHFLVKRLG